MRAAQAKGAQLAIVDVQSQKKMSTLLSILLLSDRARALAHLLLHLVCGRLILLLQLLLLLAILQYSLTASEQIYVSYNRRSCVGNVLHTETCSWQVTL